MTKIFSKIRHKKIKKLNQRGFNLDCQNSLSISKVRFENEQAVLVELVEVYAKKERINALNLLLFRYFYFISEVRYF